MHAHMRTLFNILHSHIPWRNKKTKKKEKKKGDRSQHFAFISYSLWKLKKTKQCPIWLDAAVLNTRDKDEARTTPTQPRVNLSSQEQRKSIHFFLCVSTVEKKWEKAELTGDKLESLCEDTCQLEGHSAHGAWTKVKLMRGKYDRSFWEQAL